MQEFSRIDKINEQLLQHISSILSKKMRDPRVHHVTVLKVVSTKDLSKAKVFFSILNEEDANEVEKILNRASGFFRSELAGSTKMRFVPVLRFIFDPCLIKGQKIDNLLSKLIKDAAQ